MTTEKKINDPQAAGEKGGAKMTEERLSQRPEFWKNATSPSEERIVEIANHFGGLEFEVLPHEIYDIISALLAARKRVAELEEENIALEKRIDEHECGMGVSIDYEESEALQKRLDKLREQT